MRVAEAAASLGVSPRRVRALIAAGRLAADKHGREWEVDEASVAARDGRRGRRPLSARSRAQLAQALHQRSLGGLTGQDRARTAARIRRLRTADDPAGLLVQWWGGRPGSTVGFGTNLVDHALSGNNAYVKTALARARYEYLRNPADLAEIVNSERTIAGLTRPQLAERALQSVETIRLIEHARPVGSPGAIRKVLRALDIEPTALPDLHPPSQDRR